MPVFRRAALVAALSLATLAIAQEAFSPKSVIQMKKAGLSDTIILSTINSQPGKIAYTTDDLAEMKKAGVSDEVVAALVMHTGAPAAANAAPAAAAPLVDEVGAYYRDEKTGKWVRLTPEVVNFKSGGFLKSLATDGIVKGDMNGHLKGKTSPTIVTFPLQILIYAPEGVDPTEYLLLKLRENGSNREFRSQTGGVFHTSSGATRDAVEFKAEKIAPRTYRIVLDRPAKTGEYGILPPGSYTSSNAASGGKIFTFSVKE